jgi:hypothetical protein
VENDSRGELESEKRVRLRVPRRILMETAVSLRELREEDLDAVSAGFGLFGILNLLNLLFANLHLGRPHFGNLFSGENVVEINTAVQIAVVIGGGSVVQVINQSNVV